MKMEDATAPIDPVVFRTACEALFEWANERDAEMGGGFSMAVGGPMFFMDHYGFKEGDEASQQLSFASSMRLMALMGLLRRHEADLPELIVPSDEGTRDLHVALFEAAAVAPLKDGNFDLEDVLAEAKTRVKDIDRLTALLGEE